MTDGLELSCNHKESCGPKQCQYLSKEIYIGSDVFKDKHDCFIANSNGEILYESFTIHNNREGFETLFQRIKSLYDPYLTILQK